MLQENFICGQGRSKEELVMVCDSTGDLFYVFEGFPKKIYEG